MSIKSWTWFDEELDAISSLGSSRPSLASSTLTLTRSLTVSQQNLILSNGFLINPPPSEASKGKQSHMTSTLRNLLYREEYSDEVVSLTEVSRPSYDLGYQSQSKSEGGLNMYDDVPSSGVILDIDLSDGSCDQLPLPKSGIRRFSFSHEREYYQDSERLSLSEPPGEVFGSPPNGSSARSHCLDLEENTFSCDTSETFPSFLKTFAHGSPDLYGRLYFGSEEDLEVGNSVEDDLEVVVLDSFLFPAHLNYISSITCTH